MRYFVLWVTLALTGCASLPHPFSRHLDPRAEPQVRECAQLFKDVDAAVAKAGVSDGGEARVKGYPYLRTTRFLASLKDKLATPTARDQWITLLRQADLKARRYEVLNLGSSQDVLKRLDLCGERLAKIDATGDTLGDNLKGAVFVPPDYQTWKRVLGVYALTRIPFASGVRGYQRETQEIFRTPAERLKIRGKLVRYGPDSQAVHSEEDSAESPDHPLGLPQRSPREMSRLFERHAPVFEVDEAGDFDRIGALTWAANNRLSVDPKAPTTYRRATYTRYHDRVLLQLVYSVWFSARPKTSAFDLLGGQLDGVVWRVTLDEQDRPLLFDSIHPCGCYHQFFPTPRVQLKPKPDTLDEDAFVPQRLSSIEAGQRVVVRIASRTHYLERISMVTDHPAIDKTYAFADDDDLRSLPMGEKRRSAFRSDGIVCGSERGERFFFWPMGVRNAGAMRQYGRHATAFVGKRHFDDEDLIGRYFVIGEEKE